MQSYDFHRLYVTIPLGFDLRVNTWVGPKAGRDRGWLTKGIGYGKLQRPDPWTLLIWHCVEQTQVIWKNTLDPSEPWLSLMGKNEINITVAKWSKMSLTLLPRRNTPPWNVRGQMPTELFLPSWQTGGWKSVGAVCEARCHCRSLCCERFLWEESPGHWWLYIPSWQLAYLLA